MGHLPTGFEAALHRCRAPGHHNWLPCMVGPPFNAIFLKGAGGRAPKSRKPLSQNPLPGLQGYTSTKPPGRSGRPPSVSPHGRQAGMILLEVCRVRDRQGNQGRYFEGQTVSQLHQNTLQTPQNTQKPANSQQPTPSYTPCGRPSTPCRLPALLGQAMGSSRQPQMPCHHFNKGKPQNQRPLAAAVAVFSQKPSQPRLG